MSYYGYGSDYGVGSHSHSAGFNYGTWSGYSRWSFEKETDDDSHLMIKEPLGYDTPTKADIRSEFIGNYRVKKDERTYDLIKNLSRYFYHRMLEKKDIYESPYDDLENCSEEQQHEQENMASIISNLEDEPVYGSGPFEKACNVIRKMMDKNPDRDITSDSLREDAEEGDIQFDERAFFDAELNELADANSFTKKHKFSILNKISLMKQWGEKFKIEKEIDERRVHNSEKFSTKRMISYEELNKVLMYQRLLPTFEHKLATKDLNVSVPVESEEKKQKLIMLLDYSGSMSYEEKQQWVCAIVMERLKFVLEEECEIFFSYFLDRTDFMKFHHVYDKKSALAFWSTFSTQPNGGDTCLGDMVNYLNREINERHKLHNLDVELAGEKVEILAINDGQDTVKTDNFDYKTNAITLMDGPNTELKGLCLKNTGKYVDIKHDGKIEEYE